MWGTRGFRADCKYTFEVVHLHNTAGPHTFFTRTFFKQFSEFSAWLHSVPTTIHGSYLLSACQNSVNSTLAHTRPVGIVVSRAFVFLFKVLKKEAVFIIWHAAHFSPCLFIPLAALFSSVSSHRPDFMVSSSQHKWTSSFVFWMNSDGWLFLLPLRDEWAGQRNSTNLISITSQTGSNI